MNKILVIEDEQSVRFSTSKILEFEGFEVIEAENGEVGAKLAKETRPDLILCDIMMPVLDGYDVQNELSQDPSTRMIPFVFLTAKADRADMRLAMNLGADDYLTKPFTRDELLETVCSRLDKQAAVHQQYQSKIEQIRGNITTSLPAELFIPLQNIRSFLETLTDQTDLLPDGLSKALTESYDASLQLERLLQNFLLYALLETTINDPNQVEAFKGNCLTDSAEVISEVAQEKAQACGRGEDLQLQVQPSSLPILAANLAKIVEEVVDNAFKFSVPGSAVRIESAVDAGQLQLEISDQGSGPSSQDMEQIDSTVQFSQKLHGKGGAGLGLAIAKRLTEIHDGTLILKREPHRTIVRVTVPAAA